MHGSEEAALRERIGKMLEAGLKTQTEPFPETDKAYGALLQALRDLSLEDLSGKLVLSGFVDKPYGPEQMRCHECMHYLLNRKWCDLPELAVPVEPHWWCRLWRI